MEQVLIELIHSVGWLGFAFLLFCLGISVVIFTYTEYCKWRLENPFKK